MLEKFGLRRVCFSSDLFDLNYSPVGKDPNVIGRRLSENSRLHHSLRFCLNSNNARKQ
jgi:hypothetical protein